ncbi:MAG TPA: ABATE domain-containing protein [Stellaceae bacterium]|nr:ABATE domain-containing protein [Stellaceae bacterium]
MPIPASREDLAIDFANTLFWRGSEAPSEALADFPALLAWLGRAGMPQAMLAAAPAQREAALFAEAVELRESIYRIFSDIAEGRAAAALDLAALNAALARAPPRTRLLLGEGGYAWAAEPSASSAAGLLAPVLWSAADLLARGERLKIRRCANLKCLWLFIDRSKAGTRRWCDMAACGNRAKAQRHYRRVRRG